jgi:DNA repair ATPase RecN
LPIPPSEIVPRGEQTLRALQEIRFQIAAETDVALNSIQKEISEFAEKSDRRWQSVTEILSGLRSLPQLNDMLRQWSLEQSQLDSWDRALARRSQMLVDQEKEISQIYDSWRATREQTTVAKVALQKITIPLWSLKY